MILPCYVIVELFSTKASAVYNKYPKTEVELQPAPEKLCPQHIALPQRVTSNIITILRNRILAIMSRYAGMLNT